MELVKLLKEKITDISTFLRKNVYTLALCSCLLNLTNCNSTTNKPEAQQEINKIIKEVISNRFFPRGIELSEQDSAIINQQVKNLITRIEKYTETTETTYQLNQKEVMYTALLAELTILQEKLKNTKLSPEERETLTKEALYIETILTNSDTYVYVVDENTYDLTTHFLKLLWLPIPPKPSPIQPQQ